MGWPRSKGYGANVSKESYDARTTIMLGNLPKSGKLTADKLLGLLTKKGFAGKFDFFYMPIDFQTYKNMGYAFVNFRESADADECIAKFEGFSDWPGDFGADPTGYRKACKTGYGVVQGLDANLKRFKKSTVPSMDMEEDYKPMIFDEDGARVPLEEALWKEPRYTADAQEKEETPPQREEGQEEEEEDWGTGWEEADWGAGAGWNDTPVGHDSRNNETWYRRHDEGWHRTGLNGAAQGAANFAGYAGRASWWRASNTQPSWREAAWEGPPEAWEEKRRGQHGPAHEKEEAWQLRTAEARSNAAAETEAEDSSNVAMETKALDALPVVSGQLIEESRAQDRPGPLEGPAAAPQQPAPEPKPQQKYACPECAEGFVKWSSCQQHIMSPNACPNAVDLGEKVDMSELQKRCREKAQEKFDFQ